MHQPAFNRRRSDVQSFNPHPQAANPNKPPSLEMGASGSGAHLRSFGLRLGHQNRRLLRREEFPVEETRSLLRLWSQKSSTELHLVGSRSYRMVRHF